MNKTTLQHLDDLVFPSAKKTSGHNNSEAISKVLEHLFGHRLKKFQDVRRPREKKWEHIIWEPCRHLYSGNYELRNSCQALSLRCEQVINLFQTLEAATISADCSDTMNQSIPNSRSGDNLKGLTGGSSGHDIIAMAMSRGKCHPVRREDSLSNSNHSLNNSSHGVSDALNSSGHDTSDKDLDFSNHSDSSSRNIIVPRYADANKVSAKQRFTTESGGNFKKHKVTPSGRKLN